LTHPVTLCRRPSPRSTNHPSTTQEWHGRALTQENTMERTKTYTMELHRMDPSQLISHEGRRPMQVNEVIQHLCRGDWPAEPVTQPTSTPHQD
jgi:hypothetical protein